MIYTYGDVSVTRVDINAETNFYLGNKKKISYFDKPDIQVKWPGRDGAFKCYLIFHDDQSVELMPEMGWFANPTPKRQFYISNRFNVTKGKVDNAAYIHWMDSLRGKFGAIRMVESSPNDDENHRNLDNQSTVKVLKVNLK